MPQKKSIDFFPEPLILYNIFPRLLGNIENWYPHVDRAHEMEFNAVYVNPFHYPGLSGSLYAIKSHFQYNPLFMDQQKGKYALFSFCDYVHSKGMKVIMDLIINHVSIDADLVAEHPDWFSRGEDGEIKRPCAMNPANPEDITVWGDLAEIDNANSPDKRHLWQYWTVLIRDYLDMGFDGFRCDAAYQVPVDLWQYIMQEARRQNPNVLFIAETLGCTEEQLVTTATAKFDYIYNSSKWWDFKEDWCLKQHALTSEYTASLSFPETHDTVRLYEDADGNEGIMKICYQFAAFFSKGLMIPIGFEYGFRRKLDVVNTMPQDWEAPNIDLTEFIRRVNYAKKSHLSLSEEGRHFLVDSPNPNVFLLRKAASEFQEIALLLVNLDTEENQILETKESVFDLLGAPNSSEFIDLSIGEPILPNEAVRIDFKPAEIKLFIAKTPSDWWVVE